MLQPCTVSFEAGIVKNRSYLKMSIRHSVLSAIGVNTFVFAVLRCLTIYQEVLIVGALSVHSDGVAPVHNGQHVLPVSNGVWHQDFFYKASVAAS